MPPGQLRAQPISTASQHLPKRTLELRPLHVTPRPCKKKKRRFPPKFHPTFAPLSALRRGLVLCSLGSQTFCGELSLPVVQQQIAAGLAQPPQFGGRRRRFTRLRCPASAERAALDGGLEAPTACRLRCAFLTSPLVHGSDNRSGFAAGSRAVRQLRPSRLARWLKQSGCRSPRRC